MNKASTAFSLSADAGNQKLWDDPVSGPLRRAAQKVLRRLYRFDWILQFFRTRDNDADTEFLASALSEAGYQLTLHQRKLGLAPVIVVDIGNRSFKLRVLGSLPFAFVEIAS